MTDEEIKKALIPGSGLEEEELKEAITFTAELKRYIEVMIMIPGAEEEEASDPAEFRKKYGLSRDYKEDAGFFLNPETSQKLNTVTEEEYLKTVTFPAFRYAQFIGNKLYFREQMRTKVCVPDNEELKKWRDRQMNRCLSTAGTASYANILTPCVIELSEGCSVGCKFCAVGAEKLKSVFRYTEDNAKLFNEVLDVMQDILGQSAYSGALYYCCEPLDNPDYEKFSEDFYNRSGRQPQVTTAVALRDKDRTHRLLKDLDSKPSTIYRFSVLSKEQAEQIFAEFDPVELMRVELIPQYPEASMFKGFASAGRARENDYYTDSRAYESICCITGFVINMPAKTVRMLVPVSASDEYPTGEIFFDKRQFTDAEDLWAIVNDMIGRNINNKLPRDKNLKFYDYVSLREDKEHGTVLCVPGYQKYLESVFNGSGKYTAEFLLEGKHKASEIVSEVTDLYHTDPVDVYSSLYYFWKEGLIDEFH